MLAAMLLNKYLAQRLWRRGIRQFSFFATLQSLVSSTFVMLIIAGQVIV